MLAMVSFAYDWDWKTAEEEFKRALELNPNSSDPHQWYSYYLTASRWLQRAMQQRDGVLVFMNVDPMFEDLRSDPRYGAVIQQVGLPARK